MNCPSTDFYWWTWTGSGPIEVAPDGEPVIAVGDTVRISTVCNPNFIDGWGDDCDEYDSEGWCTDVDQWFFVESMVSDANEQSYQTGLNCPQCGCTETHIVPLTDFPVENLARSVKRSKGGK